MFLPLLGLGGANWAAWITTILVWLLLAAATIALLALSDKNTKK